MNVWSAHLPWMLLQDRRARCITCVPDGAWKIFPEEVVTLFIPIYRIHADKSIDLIRSRVERQIGRWKMGNWYSGHYDFVKAMDFRWRRCEWYHSHPFRQWQRHNDNVPRQKGYTRPLLLKLVNSLDRVKPPFIWSQYLLIGLIHHFFRTWLRIL